ncbi:hypothetical protein R1sor_020060 [Riccia sorocarpa]|uniref:Uncharacterized protein n=1 Tax=Riccia sorocarpa TaxID=122646 RepID=A0ABD3IE90_9MARC
MADALLLKKVCRILTGQNEEWVRLAEKIIEHQLQNSSHPADIKNWSAKTALLGLSALRIKGSKTLDRMLSVWFAAKKKLRWDPTTGPIPKEGTPRRARAGSRRRDGHGRMNDCKATTAGNSRLPRSTTLPRLRRRRRTPETDPSINEEQRRIMREYIQDIFDRWGSVPPLSNQHSHAMSAQWVDYTSPEQIRCHILGDV